MSGYRNEWPCCGDETYTEAWEPERCPFCELNDAQDRIAELETELEAARAQQSGDAKVAPKEWRKAVQRAVDELSIMDESEGIAGFHLNGDVSPWSEGELPAVRDELQALLSNIPPADKPEGEWIRCSERLPKLGQRVQLFSQGVIQHMMPIFDDSDEGLFWDFEVYDYNPPVDFSQDQWKPLPAAPDMGGEK